MSKLSLKNGYIAPHAEFLFDYYWRVMGAARSYYRLVPLCAEMGILNFKTGFPPTRMSIFKAIWRWAIRKENFDKAYEIANKALFNEGKFMTREEWKEFLKEKIRPAYQIESEGEYKRFLKRNDYI